MLAAILSWLTGGGIAAIGRQLNEAYAAKLKASSDRDRLEADKLIAELEARRAVLLAEQGNWRTDWIRPAFALPFIVYNFKIVVWDKVLGLGVTDALSPDFVQMEAMVFAAYFIGRAVEKTFRR